MEQNEWMNSLFFFERIFTWKANSCLNLKTTILNNDPSLFRWPFVAQEKHDNDQSNGQIGRKAKEFEPCWTTTKKRTCTNEHGRDVQKKEKRKAYDNLVVVWNYFNARRRRAIRTRSHDSANQSEGDCCCNLLFRRTKLLLCIRGVKSAVLWIVKHLPINDMFEWAWIQPIKMHKRVFLRWWTRFWISFLNFN